MTIGNSVYPPITINGSAEEKITPVLLTNANTEYQHSLQNGVAQIRIKAREYSRLQIAFKVGESATNFWTIPRGCCDSINGISFDGKILYVQADKSNVTVEIMELF
jgi:hypothetical protein